MTIESLVAEQFINARLRADTVLVGYLADGANGIYSDVLPVSAGYPAVQIVYYSGADLTHLGNAHIWTDLYYIVRGVCEGGSFVPLKEIAKRITAALDGAEGSASDGVVFGALKTGPFRMAEADGERQYRHLGGFFRIFAKES
jgi:hypothetical protein